MSSRVSERVLEVIAKTRHLPIESVTVNKTFQELNIDSLDGMNIVFAIEEEFGINIPDDAAASLRSVRDVVVGIEGLLAQKQQAAAE
jgi:acyl carrier protein